MCRARCGLVTGIPEARVGGAGRTATFLGDVVAFTFDPAPPKQRRSLHVHIRDMIPCQACRRVHPFRSHYFIFTPRLQHVRCQHTHETAIHRPGENVSDRALLTTHYCMDSCRGRGCTLLPSAAMFSDRLCSSSEQVLVYLLHA